MGDKLKSYKAFTYVEMAIVVMIIGLLTAIAFPGLLRSRLNANERAAVGNLRVARDGLEQYRMMQTPSMYPVNFETLASATLPFIDETLANATQKPGKQGYVYTYTPIGDNKFTLMASPLVPGITGNATFMVDEGGEVREYGETAVSAGARAELVSAP